MQVPAGARQPRQPEGAFLGANDNRTEALVRHIDYVAQLVGDEHVGLRLDFVYDTAELDEYMEKMAATFPKSMGYDRGLKMVEPERLPRIIEALMSKGYGQASLIKILGGNFLRLAREILE